MADNQNFTDKHNVTNKGDRFEATVTRYFDDMDKAVQWAESTYSKDSTATEEPAASDMTPKDAEELNSHVNPAPIPAGAEQVLSGGGPSNDGTTEGAQTPDEAANELAVNNTAQGTHDPTSDSGVQEAKSSNDTSKDSKDSKSTNNN